jgi:uncharacterized protein YecE (DUF72 family)
VRRGATPDRKGRTFVGTSGWTYDSWRGPFYPQEVAKKRWLQWYGARFLTTEINGSFYRTPSLEAVREWRRCTPDGFIFAWKASKFITHWKRLKATCANSIALMETRLSVLGRKAGPVLFQLPGNFEMDCERLSQFLNMLPRHRPYAFEFRHPSWYHDRVYEALAAHDVALCLADHHLAPAPWLVTAGHVYVRGHGPEGRYRDSYPERVLRDWARHILAWQRDNRDVYVYFDNDQKSAAPADARRLCEFLRDERQRMRRPKPVNVSEAQTPLKARGSLRQQTARSARNSRPR